MNCPYCRIYRAASVPVSYSHHTESKGITVAHNLDFVGAGL
jgi:hypothetical protein